jgi:hypothetical protein
MSVECDEGAISEYTSYNMHHLMVARGEDVGKLLGVQFTSGRLGDACETGHKSLHSASMS